MREQNSQFRIIAVLLIVLISLSLGLFFIPITPTAVVDANTERNHNRYRQAEMSSDLVTEFTQTLVGDGQENVIDVFYRGDIYIFGNTTSSDYDFTRSGCFVAVVTPKGETKAFYEYGDTLKKVINIGTDFVLGMQSDIPYLIAISDSGEIRRKQAVPSSEGENIEDLIVLTDGYGVVTSKVGDIGNTRLKLTTFDETLQYRSSISAKENYSLGYVDTLIIADKPYLLANAFGMSKNMRAFGVWGHALTTYPLDFSYTVKDFWIRNGEFVYLVETDRGSAVIDGDDVTALNGKPKKIIAEDDIYASTTYGLYKNGSLSDPFDISYYSDYVCCVKSEKNKTSVKLIGKKEFAFSFSASYNSPSIFACSAGVFVIDYAYKVSITKLSV